MYLKARAGVVNVFRAVFAAIGNIHRVKFGYLL